MRYLLQLAYNGTNYHGWQKQQNAPSVQALIDEKLSLLTGMPTETLGCGRTDTGVHALDFYAHFDVPQPLETERIVYKLNKMLPDDIAIYALYPVADDFNARFDALYREYEYHISRKKDPFKITGAWHWQGSLDVERMNEAAMLMIGKKDFECFSKVHTQVNNFICEVMKAGWEEKEDLLVFTIRANRFLRNMVRAIVGTLVDVGRGAITLPDVEQILASRNRCEAGPSVPARGLYLTQVAYQQFVK